MQEEMQKKLAALMGDETKAKAVADKAAEDGFTDTASCSTIKEEEWIAYGMTKGAARKLVRELSASAPAAGGAAATAAMIQAQLPAVPTDESLLKDLQIGGVLKVQETEIVAAMRALFADRFGLFDVDDRILDLIEARANEQDETLPPVYYDFQKALRRKAHADVLQALDIRGDFVTKKRKEEFLGKFRGVWAVLSDFQHVLDGWYDELMSTVGNPMNLLAAMAGGSTGIAGIGLNQLPDTSPIRDAAVGVINMINKMFAGAGIPVARALGADAVQLTQMLSKTELIAAIGATNRDEMIRKLGLAVSPDMVRAETSAIRYVVGILRISTIGDDQLASYIVALKNMGATGIPFETLGAGRGNGSQNLTDSRIRTPDRGKTY